MRDFDLNFTMPDNINFARNLDNNYPTTSINYTKLFNIKEIKYMPYDNNKYNECINIIYGYALLSATRDLSKSEDIELDLMIKLFQSGKLTRPKKIVYFNDGSKEYIYGNVNELNSTNPITNANIEIVQKEQQLAIAFQKLFSKYPPKNK